MARIVTITPNPCIDISAVVPQLISDTKLHCTNFKKEPGGGGINVSRVIKRLGGDTLAVYLGGGYTDDYLETLLKKEEVDYLAIKTIEHTRENIVIKEAATGLQYKFGMPGPHIRECEWRECLEKVSGMHADFYVASGSISEGTPIDFFARLAFIAKMRNSKLVVDTSGEAMKAALEEGVYMIKPNLGELAFLSGETELNIYSATKAAQEIIAKEQCKIIVVSMGADGVLLVTGNIAKHLPAPKVAIRSTVGAGDSMVAGMVFGLDKGFSIESACHFGIASGSAATMNEGTALCNETDVIDLYIKLLIDRQISECKRL